MKRREQQSGTNSLSALRFIHACRPEETATGRVVARETDAPIILRRHENADWRLREPDFNFARPAFVEVLSGEPANQMFFGRQSAAKFDAVLSGFFERGFERR